MTTNIMDYEHEFTNCLIDISHLYAEKPPVIDVGPLQKKLVYIFERFPKAEWEKYSSPYDWRIRSLRQLHEKGLKTWVSIEPYPTPNIIEQSFNDILDSISFIKESISLYFLALASTAILYDKSLIFVIISIGA